MAVKSLVGLVLAFAIGFACRAFGIPSPAPPVLVGALLVVAMTIGYLVVDGLMTRQALHAINCGGPSGLAPSQTLQRPVTGNFGPTQEGAARSRSLAQLDRKATIIRLVALFGLCAAYLQGGLQKLLDFSAAVAEAQHFGLPLAPVVAGATIVTELAGSTLVLTGRYRWVGAVWLAGFTLVATFVANRFWEIPSPDRFMVENAFFEHLGLIGGFLLVAWYDLRERSFEKMEG
jgi:XapX domain-containing protein